MEHQPSSVKPGEKESFKNKVKRELEKVKDAAREVKRELQNHGLFQHKAPKPEGQRTTPEHGKESNGCFKVLKKFRK